MDGREADSDFPVASFKHGNFSTNFEDAGLEPIRTLEACCNCQTEKTRCDPGFPRCRPCEKANVVCEYSAAIGNVRKRRIYQVLLQDRIRALEQRKFQSAPEKETLQLTEETRSPGLTGNLASQEQQLREPPMSADTDSELPVKAPKLSGQRDLFITIAPLPRLNADIDGGYYTTPIKEWGASYREREAKPHYIKQRISISSRPNGGEKTDTPQSFVRAPRTAGAKTDARSKSQSFPDECVPLSTRRGEDLSRFPDLELFDINLPSPIRDVRPAFSAALIQRLDHPNLVPVTDMRTDATTPITIPGSDKNWQRSRSKTRKPFDKHGHVTMESYMMRRALVGYHESRRDTGGATEVYQIPKGKLTTTTVTRQQPSTGRFIGRKLPFAPFSSSSDTSSIYSGSTYEDSTYGSNGDSSMTSFGESQIEPQESINDAEHFGLPVDLDKHVNIECEGHGAERMAGLTPLGPYQDGESRVVAGLPYAPWSHPCSSIPEAILSPVHLAAASDITDKYHFSSHMGHWIESAIAGRGRTSFQPATDILFHPKHVEKRPGEIELFGDEFGHGLTKDKIYSDIELLEASETILITPRKRSKALKEWLKEDRNDVYVRRLGIRLADDLASTHPIVQPAEGLRLPKYAEEIQLQANDEKLSSCADTDDHDTIVRMGKGATQHKGHDEPDSVVRGPSWGFIFKHVFPLAVLLGTYFIDFYECQTRNDKYNVCVTSAQMVAWVAVIYSSPKLLMLMFRMLASLRGRNRNHGLEDRTSRLSKSIRTLDGQEYTAFNSAKQYIEHLTKRRWDWWPFVASFRPLQLDEVRVQWECESRHTHWLEISREKVPLMLGQLGATVPGKAALQPSSATLAGHRAASNASSSSQASRSRSSDGRSSPATSNTGFSGPPSDNAGCDNDGSSEQEKDHLDDVVTVNIVPPSKLNGYVLFGVQGSKRLQSSKTRLTQIDLNVCKDDDSFFDEMKVQYKELRGYLRWLFSIWVFHTCEFIMFHKANPNEVMPGPEEMPSVTDMDYRFATDRHPPILRSVFNASFYGCNKACIKSRLDVMCIFHECKGRNHCGKYRVLERLPKRQRKWEIDRDEEKDEAWGLNATFGVSFFKVALYHLLILVWPITFWGLWLRKWPTDWQNASVPFFAVVVLLSLFWLPFAQKLDFEEKVKYKIA